IELSLPLLVTVIIRKRVVETAEVWIGVRSEGNIRRVSHSPVVCERGGVHRNGIGGRSIESTVDEETIVAKREIRPQRGVPQIAGVHFIVRSIRSAHVGRPR